MRSTLDDPLIEDDAVRARDGIVAGMQQARVLGRRQAGATWILVARADERVEDFFLDSPFGAQDAEEGEDPRAWICRSVRADGTLRMGEVDLGIDRFVSEVLNDQLRDDLLSKGR